MFDQFVSNNRLSMNTVLMHMRSYTCMAYSIYMYVVSTHTTRLNHIPSEADPPDHILTECSTQTTEWNSAFGRPGDKRIVFITVHWHNLFWFYKINSRPLSIRLPLSIRSCAIFLTFDLFLLFCFASLFIVVFVLTLVCGIIPCRFSLSLPSPHKSPKHTDFVRVFFVLFGIYLINRFHFVHFGVARPTDFFFLFSIFFRQTHTHTHNRMYIMWALAKYFQWNAT